MLLKDFLDEAAEGLSRIYPSPEARKISLILCEELLGTKSYTHIVCPSYSVPEDREDVLRDGLRRLRGGEPLQYVLGTAQFCDFTFKVGPGVLIPRPETEKIVEETAGLAPASVLDLCTGSGCIAWSVALKLPGAKVFGIDVSEEALAYARNQDFGAPPHSASPVFLRADIFKDIPESLPDVFDVIVSNPPYIMVSEKEGMRPNVLGYEPHSALFVPDSDPLVFYRAIAIWAGKLLKPGGTCIVEINERLGEETSRLFESVGFSSVRIIKDYLEKDRFVSFIKQAF